MADAAVNNNNNNNVSGKKVFFLYPHSVLQSELLEILIENEYEVYLINDHQKMMKLAEIFPDSIVFINIDEALSVEDWEQYVKSLMENEKTKNIQTGIVTYNSDTELAKKFLMELMVPCGYIVLSLGLEKSVPILLKILEANEARGRRKFIRASSSENENTKFNVRIKGIFYTGRILDISAAGMACEFDTLVELEPKTELNDIQLILRGIICRVSGIIAGNRRDNKNCFVVLFKGADDKVKDKIHTYIYKQLQDSMNENMKNI